MAEEFTREYVLAQWAYSELNSPEQGKHYVGVDGLKALEARHVLFADLTQQEHARLFEQWYEVRGRGTIFADALAGVEKFQLKQWTKAQLGAAYIISLFLQSLGPECVYGKIRFKDWIEAEPHGQLPSTHPLRMDATATPFRQRHPMTVGPFVFRLGARIITVKDRLMLLDGYHRAVCFWKMADPNATLAVYVPIEKRDKG